jgi:putrescine transport system ATP-binding protein
VLSFGLPEGVAPGDPNCVAGEVVEMAYLGGQTVYHLKLASGMVLKASVTNSVRHADKQPKWGDRIYASWGRSDTVVLTS